MNRQARVLAHGWLAVLAALAGCRTYEPWPLDLAAHERGLAERRPVVAFEPADGLALAEGEITALFWNAELRLLRLQAGVAAARAEHAGRWQDPVLGGSAERILGSVPEPWVAVGSLGVTLPLSGRLGREADAATAEQAAAHAAVREREWQVRAQLRAAWHRWSAAVAREAVLAAALARLDRLAEPLQRLAERGELGGFELRAFRRGRAEVAADHRAAVAAAVTDRGVVFEVMGLQADAPVTLVPDLVPCALPEAPTAERLRLGSPRLRVLEADYAVAEARLRREIAAQWPDLTLVPGLGRDQGENRGYLDLSLPLPLWNRNRQAIAVADAERVVARARVEAALEGLLAALARAQAAFAAAAANRSELEADLAPLLREQREAIEALAAAGRLGPYARVELTHGEQQAELHLLEARLHECLAANELRLLLGENR